MTLPPSPAALAALARPSPAIQVILMKIEMAMAEVSRMCQPGERWRMTIPVDLARDSDMILCEALRAAKEFIEAASSAIPSPTPEPDYKAAFEETAAALYAVLAEEQLPNGEYVHLGICSGSRRAPPGSIGVSCCCLPSTKQLRHRIAELEAGATPPAGAAPPERTTP